VGGTSSALKNEAARKLVLKHDHYGENMIDSLFFFSFQFLLSLFLPSRLTLSISFFFFFALESVLSMTSFREFVLLLG
jgi:hypothetical protein